MDELMKLFDSLLSLLVSYPFTIIYILLFPERIFSATKSPLVCSEGGTFVVSCMVHYWIRKTTLQAKYPEDETSASKAKRYFVVLVVFSSIAVLAQYLVLSIPSLRPAIPTQPVTTMKALTYPISLSIITYNITFLIGIIIPWRSGNLTLEEKIKRFYREIRRRDRVTRNVPEENASYIAGIITTIVYCWALYNVTRVFFKFDIQQTIVATAAMVLSLAVPILPTFYFVMFQDRVFAKLGKQELIPGAADTETPKQ